MEVRNEGSSVHHLHKWCQSLDCQHFMTLHFSQMQFFALPQNAMKFPASVPLFMSLLCGTPKISAGHHLSLPPTYRTPKVSFKYTLNLIFFKKFGLLGLFKNPYPQNLKKRQLSKEQFTVMLTRLGNTYTTCFSLMEFFTGINLQDSHPKRFLVK